MQLIDHVSISVADMDTARPFYDAIFQSLGADKVYDRPSALGYGVRCNSAEVFHSCVAIYESEIANVDDKRHWCFKAKTRAEVDDFYRSGLSHGGRCNGPPGLRPHYHENYYAAFLYDPHGNRVEAVCHLAE